MKDADLKIDESLFQQLFDAAPDPIIISRADGRIAMANAEAYRKLGYESDELVDQMIEALVPDRFRNLHARQREDYNHSLRTRPMGFGLDLYARRKDGSEFPVEISLSPLRQENGHLVIAIIRDISDRKQVEMQMRQKATELARSNADLEQFAYVASHDLQEPLRAIAGSCRLLQKSAASKLNEDELSYIAFAVDGAKRLQELISDLLDYSRVTTRGKAMIPVDCEDVLRQVQANLRDQIERSGACIAHDALPVVTGDVSQMTQLFQNLISNGIKFCDGRTPRIHVGVVAEDERWVFSVRDNGIGIEEKYFDRIFVIFRRLHARERYPGSGIGLALCKKIVERHGGQIWLESEVGQGSTFHFSMPRS